MSEVPPFTEEDIDACWPHHKSYFLQVLNGDYDLVEAVEDLRSLVGHQKYDPRAVAKEGGD